MLVEEVAGPMDQRPERDLDMVEGCKGRSEGVSG
jgi:hypothetical protein